MRLLILSQSIRRMQREVPGYNAPWDVDLDIGQIGEIDHRLDFTVFDYDVAIVHITGPYADTSGYSRDLPKFAQDCKTALEHGRTIVCLPGSREYQTKSANGTLGPLVYDWLGQFGVSLRDDIGVNIKPSGSGQAQVIQDYLKSASKYYQIVTAPNLPPQSHLAIVDETNIVVGLELQVEKGILVILPPPTLEPDNYIVQMMRLVNVALRYHERAQRQIPIGDRPDWITDYSVSRARKLENEITNLAIEKSQFERLEYVLFGTGDELQDSVALLLEQLDLKVDPQPKGANVDLKATHPTLNLGFAIEVTGTKGTIQKDSSKVGQAWEYFKERSGTPEENDRLLVVANTECHLDPKERKKASFSANAANLLGGNGALMITTQELYDLWKSVHEREHTPEDIVQELHRKFGLYSQSS